MLCSTTSGRGGYSAVTTANQVNLTLKDVYELSAASLAGCGASKLHTSPVAESIRDAEADGIRNVGLNYLSHYCEHLLCGKVDGKAQPTLVQSSASVLLVDAKNGFAHSAFMTAFDSFVELVQRQGVCVLGIRNSYAAGVIGWYVEKLARRGLVAMAFANSPPAIAPWGGSKSFFGTNPLAFGVPRPDSPPLIIDQSSSVTAKVNVVHAAQAGQPIPETWALDEQGSPTTDAQAGLRGSMAPSGGYKGVAMAMIVDLLAGALCGPNMSHCAAAFGDNTGGFPGVGQFFIGIDPGAFTDQFALRTEQMFVQMCLQDNVRLPGERRHQHRRKAQTQGVWLSESLYEKLKNYA